MIVCNPTWGYSAITTAARNQTRFAVFCTLKLRWRRGGAEYPCARLQTVIRTVRNVDVLVRYLDS